MRGDFFERTAYFSFFPTFKCDCEPPLLVPNFAPENKNYHFQQLPFMKKSMKILDYLVGSLVLLAVTYLAYFYFKGVSEY
ncbi:MAG: hypothetical protein OHK0019_08190 [Saprospiraceae bacterium]